MTKNDLKNWLKELKKINDLQMADTIYELALFTVAFEAIASHFDDPGTVEVLISDWLFNVNLAFDESVLNMNLNKFANYLWKNYERA